MAARRRTSSRASLGSIVASGMFVYAMASMLFRSVDLKELRHYLVRDKQAKI